MRCWCVVMVLFFLVSTCSLFSNSGYIRQENPDGRKMMVQELTRNWENYHIYYAGYGLKMPLGLLFDPKGDTQKISGESWTPVRSREELETALTWLYTHIGFMPRLCRIYGPDDRLYGILLYCFGHVFIEQIDKDTLYIYDLEPIDSAHTDDSGDL